MEKAAVGASLLTERTRYLAHICCFLTLVACDLKLRATSFKLSVWLAIRSRSVWWWRIYIHCSAVVH